MAAKGAEKQNPQRRRTDSSHTPLTHLLIGVGLGVVLSHAPRITRQLNRRWASWAFARRPHELAGPPVNYAGSPQDVEVLRRRGYAVGFSRSSRTPLWASMIVCDKSTAAAGKRSASTDGSTLQSLVGGGAMRSQPGENDLDELDVVRARSCPVSFRFDPEIARTEQVSPRAFARSGYHRGHLAPRATVAFDTDSSKESFYMTNVVPLVPEFNQRWAAVEQQTRRWAARHGELAIVVGVIGPNDPTAAAERGKVGGAPVPSKLYLAALSLDDPSKGIGIVMSNDKVKPSQGKGDVATDMWARAVSLRELERDVGVPIFRQLPWRWQPWPWDRGELDLTFWRDPRSQTTL